MKKAEKFTYMLFAITLFASITMTHFWGIGVVTMMVTMLCGMAFAGCFMLHETKED